MHTIYNNDTPKFGAFARQVHGVSSEAIERRLAEQAAGGGRLGSLLVSSGDLSYDQLLDILARQARWAAELYDADLRTGRFPVPTPFSLCMPCYNEGGVVEDWLRTVLSMLPAFFDEFQVVVVDDGSTDDTAKIIRRLSDEDNRVKLVQHGVNRGYGAAVTTALRAAEGELICLVDGDGQFNLLDLPRLLIEAEHGDVVIGYRFDRADTRLRKLNAASWNRLIRMCLGVKVTDLDCAFKLFPRWVVEQMSLESQGACISAEMMVQCTKSDLTIRQIPVKHFPRYLGDATGANVGVVLKAFRELPKLMRHRSASPLQRPESAVSSHRYSRPVDAPAADATADQSETLPKESPNPPAVKAT